MRSSDRENETFLELFGVRFSYLFWGVNRDNTKLEVVDIQQ